MKKILIFLVLVNASMFLVACSTQESMAGESKKQVTMLLTDLSRLTVMDAEGFTTNMTIYTYSKTFIIKGFSGPTVKFEQKNGVITVNIIGSERQDYKNSSEAYEEELEGYGLRKRKNNFGESH